MTINRATFLNALLTLHEVGGYKEIPEEAFESLFASMGLTSDEAVTHINESQKDGLVHLRWRGWVTLTEKGHAVAEGKGAATHAAAFAEDGANEPRLDALAGNLFGAIQFVSAGPDAYDLTDKARAAINTLALAATEKDKAAVVAGLESLKAALGAFPAASPVPLSIAIVRKTAASIAPWAGVAWA